MSKDSVLNSNTFDMFNQDSTSLISRLFRYIIPPAILTALTTAFYYPSLNYPFQFDDLANITKNFAIRSYSLTSQMFSSRRWISNIFNAISFKLGRFDPFYYRALNLLIHLAAGILLFYFIYYLCRGVKKRAFLKNNALAIATTTSALFLLHPVQTQTVSYVIQARLEGLASLFIIAGLFFFAAALRSKNLVTKGLLLASFFGIGALATGTKEIVIVMPFLAVLVDWFFIAEESWDAFKPRLFIYVAFTALVLVALLSKMKGSFLTKVLTLNYSTMNNRGNILTSHAYDKILPIPYLISQFKVVLHYLVMFVYPFNICVEYDWKLSNGFFAPDAFFPFLVLAAILGFVGYSMYRKKYGTLCFGLLWFFITVAPRSSIIPSPELIVDYKTYLASIGIHFILASALVAGFNFACEAFASIPTMIRSRQGYMAAMLVMSVGLGYASMERNKVWSSSYAFWKDIVEKAPGKARAHNNLGVAYAEMGQHDKAIPCYLQAMKMDKYYTDPYNNASVYYSTKGDLPKAIGALNQALRIFPYYPEAYNNRGSLLTRQKRFDLAERDLKMAIKLRPHYGKAYYNLGNLYYQKKELARAWDHFKKASEVDLDDSVSALQTLGQLSLHLKKYDEATLAFGKMLHYINRSKKASDKKLLPSASFNLANAYFMSKHYDKAEPLYAQLREMNPKDARFAHNLGEVQFARKNYKQALQTFDGARRMPRSLAQSHLRFANCFEHLKQIGNAKTYLNNLINAKIPEKLKKQARAELTRINLQEKVNAGGGTIKMSDLADAQQVLSGETSQKIALA